MPRIDLITGFLGSGKTTFLRWYAKALMEQKQNIGILENDFGAVNVDTMLLQDLEGDLCELEMVAGGCDYDCHRRRFKTKLIAMGMVGYDSVLVEPSGVYDVDEFFDVLWEDPLDRWYRIGSVIAIVDARLEENLSEEAEYLLVSQTARAGLVIFSRSQEASREEMEQTVMRLNRSLEKFGCSRRFRLPVPAVLERLPEQTASPAEQTAASAELPADDTLYDEVLIKDWSALTSADLTRIRRAGYRQEDHRKLFVDHENGFETLYYLQTGLSEDAVQRIIPQLFADSDCGQIFRVKGFLHGEEKTGRQERVSGEAETWIQVNATGEALHMNPVRSGQEVLIVIGENLREDRISRLIGKPAGKL